MQNREELLSLLIDMTKAIRCCQQETVFCEGVTFTQFYILELVSRHETLKLNDLHGLLSVEKSTSTRLLEPLINQGSIIREKSEEDSRAINLKLSKKGQKVYNEMSSCFDCFLERLDTEIPQQKKEEVFESVTIFAKALKSVFYKHINCGKR